MRWHVAGDWGTTRLRLNRIEAGRVVDRLDGPGIGTLEESPAAALERLLAGWKGLGVPAHVILCGMAGARNGLREAPYVACPATVDDWRDGMLRFDLGGVPVRIAAGVRFGNLDMMRGEETQIYGALSRDPSLAQGRHLLLLPGTHSKWAWVQDGAIVACRTWFTGEMFGLLRDRSSLVRAGSDAGGAADREAGWGEGLARGRAGVGLLGEVFQARAAQLLQGRSAAWGRAVLSGLLIGSEVGEGLGLYAEPSGRILVIGAPDLTNRYIRALSAVGMDARTEDGDVCALAGLELSHDR